MSQLTNEQIEIITLIIRCVSPISILASLYVIWNYFRYVHNHGGYYIRTTQTMVTVLACLDLLLTLPKLFGPSFNDAKDGTREQAFCVIQGFSINFFAIAVVMWNTCIAHTAYRSLVYRDSEDRLHKRFSTYIWLTFTSSLLLSLGPLFTRKYHGSIFYCWIDEDSLQLSNTNSLENVVKLYQFIFCYLIILLGLIYTTTILILAQRRILELVKSQRNIEVQNSTAVILSKLRVCMIVFLIVWIPAILLRFVADFIHNSTFYMGMLMQFTQAMQGLATAIIYGGILNPLLKMISCCCSGNREWHFIDPFYSKNNLQENMENAHVTFSPVDENWTGTLAPEKTRKLRIFTSTFNMGEGKLCKTELHKWIPLGYDMYVIGVQECLHLSHLRTIIHQYIEKRGNSNINGRNLKYHMYGREIGSTNTALGYHGYIAITVFINADDVANGAFYMPNTAQQGVNCGKYLPLGHRASNKGAVGIAFRYFDTSFAFATCHLSSDSKGKSKILRRNQDARDMLEGLNLHVDDLGFEFQNMHNHSFVLGDLNYRLTRQEATPMDILQILKSIYQTQPTTNNSINEHSSGIFDTENEYASGRSKRKQLRQVFEAMSRRGSQTQLTDLPLESFLANASNQHEQPLRISSRNDDANNSSTNIPQQRLGRNHDPLSDQSNVHWQDLLQHDELSTWMNASQIFFEFQERDITFPPTFRRKRGCALPKDGSRLTIGDLLEYFTISVESGSTGIRVPSYPDRILYSSQNDMKKLLKCTKYISIEDIVISDHKPVVAIFNTMVDATATPAIDYEEMCNFNILGNFQAHETETKHMTDLVGVADVHLHVGFESIDWKLQSMAMEARKNDFDAPESDGDLIEISVVFPIPLEDIFSDQRKLHEVAEAFSGSIFHSSSNRRQKNPHEFQSLQPWNGNVARKCWVAFQQQGLTHRTLARIIPTDNMHVAIKLDRIGNARGLPSKCLGQGIICLPMEFGMLKDGGGKHRFKINLSVGGKFTAVLTGFTEIRMYHPQRNSVSSPPRYLSIPNVLVETDNAQLQECDRISIQVEPTESQKKKKKRSKRHLKSALNSEEYNEFK